MKPGKNADQIIENQNCSCTSCVYKSASDRPSLRRFIAKGSRIDKLYYGKYIPLRERKLIDKLVRTRGVYDDIRAQLVSDSTLSSNKPDLNPERRLPAKDLQKENNSSAVMELVNLVDKGADLGSKKLSDCCSCCSCSSKIHVHEHVKRTRRFRRGQAGGHAYEYAYTKEKVGAEYHKKRGVRFKSKHIRSDPCFCTLKFSGLIKNQSKLLRKIRRDNSVPALEIMQTTEENVKKQNKLQELTRASYEKLRESNMRVKELVSEGARKVRESKNIIGENIRANTKRSIEKVKDAKDKLKQNIKTDIRKSRFRAKEKNLSISCLCPEKELFFKIKKDSVSKFKDDLKKKQLMKYWECEPECIENTCVPEECFKKLKLRNLRRKKSLRQYGKNIKQDRKIGDLLNKSDVRIQSQSQLVNTKMGTDRQNQILHAGRNQEIVEPQHNFEPNVKNKPVVPQVEINLKKDKNSTICECDNIPFPKKQDATNTKKQDATNAKKQDVTFLKKEDAAKAKKLDLTFPKKQVSKAAPPPSVSHSPKRGELTNVENIDIAHRPVIKSNADKFDNIQIMKPPIIERPKPKQKKRHRQAVRIGSTFSFNVEFYKERSGSNASHSESANREKNVHPEYRHKSNKEKKSKKRRQIARGSQVKLQDLPKNTQSGSHALKRCFCTLKLKPKKKKPKISKVGKGTSTAESSTSGPYRKDLNFKCSMKACKNDPSQCINQWCDSLEYEKRRQNRANEVSTNTEIKAKRVLKFSKSGKRRKKKERELLPYECAPGVCVPDDCNPEECIKLINKRERKKKLKDTASGSYHCSCKTKSTSSFTSKPMSPINIKQVQPYMPYRNSIPKMSREHVQMLQKTSVNKNRQAVRIGSSFSFNIQFYKENIPATPSPTNVKSITFKPKIREQTRPKERNVQKKKSKPTQVNKKERNVHIGTTLKRCFCTLKLQKKENTKSKNKMLNTGTDTINPGYLTIEMSTKGTKINRKDRSLLEPFECEPYTCIPGACDPYLCLERINKRNMRLKNIGLTTTSPVMITESSSTELEKTSKPVQIKLDQPSKSHKTLTKPYIIKKYSKKEKQLGSGDSSFKTKRAVKLGSTFSFDIQFYKNHYESPNNPLKNEVDEVHFKRNTIKKYKDKGVKEKVSNNSHVNTQAKAKGRNKASLVRPILKKCFCTLNLVKKQNKQYRKADILNKNISPLIYTVNKVITANTIATCVESAFHKKRCYSSVYNKFCEKSINLRSTSTNSNIAYKAKPHRQRKVDKHYSEISFTLEHTNKINESLEEYSIYKKSVKNCEKYTTKALNNTRIKRENSYEKQKQCLSRKLELTGLQRYLNRYYFTMNMQTKNIQISKLNKPLQTGNSNREKRYNRRKLEPYECEPGICVPGECDPYDCQKIILKRMKKHTSKKFGTESTSRSTSSNTGHKRLDFGSIKTENTEKNTSIQLRRKMPENVQHSNKQAVRLGSSFSFDIEFFKDNSNFSKGRMEPKYSSDTKLAKRVKQRHKKFKSSSTKGQEINSIDQKSQSGSLMLDKASHAATDTKRCFCTLKLQKKGRLYKEHAKKDKNTIITKEPYVAKAIMSTKSQNTVKMKPVKVKRKLEPYECEPGICVPGSCDPYKCLEIMKKTKGHQLGTNTKFSGNSVSSMTTSSQNRYRDHATTIKSKKKTSTSIPTRKYNRNKAHTASKQCVRIGSSFSFNVEFFKDNPTNLRFKDDIHSDRKTYEKISRPVHTKKAMKQKGSQNYKDLKHMDSQINISPLNASTMTRSLLKRCFCTAQLHAPNSMQQSQTQQPGSFKRRCMCVLKLLNKSKLPQKPAKMEITKPVVASKKINTHYISDSRPLEPYECFPGICIPGECDPYKCYEIMNKRKIDTYSRASATHTHKMRPVASYTSELLTRDRNTQMMRTKAAHIERKAYDKTPRMQGSDRQAVKIGSNFSFNIEFYKQNLTDFNGKSNSHMKKYENVNTSRIKVKAPKIKSTGANARPVSFNTTKTQAIGAKKESRAAGAKPFLKRCFCVLKLQNQLKQNTKTKETKKMAPIFKKMETKSIMTVEKIKWHSDKLDPYECEPNVCVPYQCDPVECEKLIQKRLREQKNRTKASQQGEPSHKIKWRSDKLLPYECEPNICIPYECDPYECEKRIQERLKKERRRESGTSTNQQKIAKASITDKLFVPKMKHQHTLHKVYTSHKRQRTGLIKNESIEHPPRQSVKIGSSFTFNIEFYKNNDGIDVVKLPKSDDLRPDKKHFKVNKNAQKQTKHRASQKLRDITQNKIIQFQNEIPKSQATMTNISPFSNRCFCTLYVRKPNKEKRSAIDEPRIPVTSDVSTETHKSHKLKLLPYECEPQTCIPEQCNPFECLKRIKMRKCNRKNVGFSTTNYSKSVGSAVSRVNAKSKNKNIQTKHMAVKKNEDSESKEGNGLNFESSQRQVVRIGSNFSFDIEFYKDRIIDNNLNNVTNRREEVKKNVQTTQRVNSIRHINTQVVGNTTKSVKSGLSPIWKRCFCTSKLQNNGGHTKESKKYSSKKSYFNNNEKVNDMTDGLIPPNNSNSGILPFMKKCFCNLKLHMLGNQQKHKSQNNEGKSCVINKTVNTFHYTNQKLEPYECEPGVCVPGLCNPYECEKRIQKRFLRALSTQTRPLTKNFATNNSENNKLNSVMIQSNPERNYKFKPKEEKSSAKRHINTEQPFLSDNVTNRQAVHIGSNFGFNIDFFKDIANPGLTVPPVCKNVVKTKLTKVGRPSDKKLQFNNKSVPHHKALQSTQENRKSKSTSVMPLLQRCFCTLKLSKLQKKEHVTVYKKPNVKSRSVATHSKVITREKIPVAFHNLEPYECEPFTCVPGECDPYECEKRIKMRGQSYKSQTTGTKIVKCHPKSVCVNGKSLKSQKIQSNRSDSVSVLKSGIETKQNPRFVEVPRFSNLANKNAIRIGSNFSFNIEFYKETVPETVVLKTDGHLRDIQNLENINRKPKRINKKVLVEAQNVESRKLQNDVVKTYEKGSDTGNRLKRCFCTLKLQKKEFSKVTRDKIAYPVFINNKYPQVFDVRRVTVQKKPTRVTNSKYPDVKSIATKVDTKYLKQCVCQDRRNIKIDDMHTILPYMPSKFNKKVSKTLLATYDKNEKDLNVSNKISMDKGRKLTKKISHKSIHKRQNRPVETNNNDHKSLIHRLFCKCVNNKKQMADIPNTEIPPCDVDTCDFHKQNNPNTKNIYKNKTDLKLSKSDRHHKRFSGSTSTKKSKSLKGLKKQEINQRSPSLRKSEMFSNLPVGDSDRCPRISINQRGHKQVKSTILKHGKGNSEYNDTLCSHCETQFKKKVHFQDSSSTHKQRINKKISRKSNNKYELPSRITESRILSRNKKLLKNSQKMSKSCNYCDLCGSRVDKEEIQKAAGDLRPSKLFPQMANDFLISTTDKIKSLFNCDDNDNICSGEQFKEEPLFEMKLDSQDYGIINKDEVIHSVTMLKNKMKKEQAKARREHLIHGKSCRCCICLGKKHRSGANIRVAAKGSKATGLFGNKFSSEKTRSSEYGSGKPCVCGSEICAQELEKMSTKKQKKTQRRSWRPCACGSPICKHESDMLKILSTSTDQITCQCAEEMAKRKALLLHAKMKEEAKQRAIRLKKYQKEDDIRRKQRMKENQLEEKSVKDNAKQNDSDFLLLAESVLDIAKLGFTATSDTVRCAARTAMDPKGAYASVSAMKDDPRLLFRGAKNAVAGSGVASTFRRLKYRWCAMRTVRDVKGLMEQHPATNFLLHIADKKGDRRSGMNKKRVPERFDFNCSLYMATLRKRPCLCVYDRCPWFYPHFMSVLNVWRQFSDILLFLIAVAVWSPCILAMELCRAMMCCFLCTG